MTPNPCEAIHKKGASLGQRLGSNYIIIHRKADDDLEVSASDSIRRVAVKPPGPAELRKHFAPGRLCQIFWKEPEEEALLTDHKSRGQAWRRAVSAGSTLDRLAAAADRARTPYLLFVMNGNQPLCKASPEGQQLMASE